MDRLETLVTEAFAEHAGDAPSSDRLLDSLRRPHRLRDRARHSRVLAAVTAAAVVAAVAVGIAVFRPASHHATPAGRPSGTKPITYHGITMYVPSDLKRTSLCAGPVIYGYTMGFFTSLCPGSAPRHEPPVRLAISFQPLNGDDYSGSPGSIAGVPALIRHGRVQDAPYKAVPYTEALSRQLDLDITIVSPSRQQNSAFLASLRRMPVDENGCVDHRTLITPRHPVGGSLVPGAASSATVCGYEAPAPHTGANWLAYSKILSSAATKQLVRVISELPARRFGNLATSTNGEWLWIDFHQVDGSDHAVWLVVPRAHGIHPLTVTDGRHVAYDPGGSIADAVFGY